MLLAKEKVLTATEAVKVTAEPCVAHGGHVFRVAREMGWDWRDVLDFSANINPLGIPDSVRQAIARSTEQILHYPEIGAPAFCRAAGEAWGVAPEQILAGNGATELIYFLIRALKPRRAHLVTPAFTEYRRALAGCEITRTRCRASEDYAIDLPRIAADSRRYDPDLLILTNPNNPTGCLMPSGELARWIGEELPATTQVLLDESFIDFTPRASLAWETLQRQGIFVLRSLTKFYALPGLRLGCLISGVEEIQGLEAIREPWQTNVLAEQAGIAALQDDEYRRRSVALIAAERLWLERRLRQSPGVKPLPSQANFIFAHCARPVADLQEFLLPHKVLIRDLTGVEGVEGGAFRVAVRGRADNERLLVLLEEFFP